MSISISKNPIPKETNNDYDDLTERLSRYEFNNQNIEYDYDKMLCIITKKVH